MAEAQAHVQPYNQQELGKFPALIQVLWRFTRNICLAHNILQHGATPEERLQNQKNQLAKKIREWYSTGRQEVSFLNSTRLFKVTLQKRLQIHPHINIHWLALMDSAKRSKIRNEEYQQDPSTRFHN